MQNTNTITPKDINDLPFINKNSWDVTPTRNPEIDVRTGLGYGKKLVEYLKTVNNPCMISYFLFNPCFPKKEKWSGIEEGLIMYLEQEFFSGSVFSIEDDLCVKKAILASQETETTKEKNILFEAFKHNKKKNTTINKNGKAVFEFDESRHEMTVHDKDGNKWIPAHQVGEALQSKNIRDSIIKLQKQSELIENKHWCRITLHRESDGKQSKMVVLSYRGVIRVAMRSQAKRAKAFRDWAEDVLFEVMVTGQYGEQPTKQRSSNLGKRLTNLEQAYNRMVESNNLMAKYIKDLDEFMQKTFPPKQTKQIPEQTETFSFALDDFEHDKIMKIVWYHFVETAAKKTGYVTINRWGGRTVFLKKGQLVYGQPSTAKKIGVSKNALRNRVDMLIKMGKIKREKVSNYSLITVVGL